MASEGIDPYPPFLNRPFELVVDERIISTKISAGEWMDCWRPVLQRILALHQQKPQRIMIAVGGPPGAGKSVFAAQLHWMITHGTIKGCHSVALPMDGFHYDNVHLRTHFRLNSEGSQIPLAQYKGAPDTYDIQGLLDGLKALRNNNPDIRWPAYSREMHDVVPGRHHVLSTTNVVIVEGNYMLVNRGPFRGLPSLFDLSIYIDSPAAVIISTLMTRHITGGKPEMMAKEWVKKIDLPNARLAESTKPEADVIIERSSDGEMAGLTWKPEPVAVPRASAS